MVREALLLAGSYLLGSVPFGLLVARSWAGVDVREHGSGNIGATNVFRVAGRKAGAAAMALDVGKGLVPPLAGAALGLPVAWQVAAGLAAIVGHSLSPFLRFRGGKGIATSLGVMMGVMWKVGASAAVLWGIVIGTTGYVSLGSVVAAASLTPLCLAFYPGDGARLAFAVIAGVLAIVRHRSNLARLRDGAENCFHKSPPPIAAAAAIACASLGVAIALALAANILR
jgi:glycerol-3-phosphate acyltransferase PlsY